MQLSGRYIRTWARARRDALRARRGLLTGYGIVIYRSGLVRLERIEAVRPGPQEVAVRTLASAISTGTERANYLRLRNTAINYPHSPGYSGAGEIISVGSRVNGLEVGQIVALRCKHASFAVVHSDSVYPVRNKNVSPSVLALWNLGLIALQGLHRAGEIRDRRVAVIGQGPIGLLAARLAGARGAQVDLVFRSAPSAAARASADTLLQEETALRDAAGRFDIVCDCSGNPSALNLAATLTRPRGCIVMLGSNRGTTGPFDWKETLARKELKVIGAHAMAYEAATCEPISEIALEVVTRLAEGAVKGKDLVGERLNPIEGWKFYRLLARGRAGRSGAWFDWTTIEPNRACRKRSLFAGPLRLWNEESLGAESDSGRRAIARRFAGE